MARSHPLAIWSGFVASISGFLQSYAASVIAGALLFITKEFHLTPAQEGLAASMILLGALCGSLSTGYLADRFGRRAVLFFSAVTFVASNLPIFFISSFSTLLFLRFLTGIAAGMTSLSCPLYLAEIAPPSKRGAFVGSFQLSVTLGIVAAYLINLEFADTANWRLMLACTAFPAVFQIVALFFIPESPKWLFGAGLLKKGIATQEALHSEDDFPPREQKELAASSWKTMFFPVFHKGLLIGISLVVLQQWCGINAIIYFAPKIFQNAGFADAKSAIAVSLGLGVINFLATVISLFLIDRLGRRTLLLFSQGGAGLGLLFFTLTFVLPGLSFLAPFALLFFLSTYAVGLGPLPWVLVSEIYPLAIRAHAIAVMTFLSWISNFLVVFTFPRFLSSWGPSWIFASYSAISLVSFWLFFRIIPETKGKSFEEIELLLYRS